MRPPPPAALPLLFALAAPAPAAAAPLADVHLHYTWNQTATSPEAAVAALEAQGVVLAVVMGTPPELALALRRAGGRWVVPFFSPYLTPAMRHTWFRHPEVLDAARRALEGGRYFGLGEIHLVAGLGPVTRRRHPVVDGLLALAVAFDVPILIHTEASSHRHLLPLCRRHPRARILWAHAGGILPPAEVDALLAACANVWVDLAARDPERYVENPIAGRSGRLRPGWRALLEKYPSRFMVGSDPVWPVDERDRWDRDDTGWQRLDRYLGFHRRWLAALPKSLAARVGLHNALAFLRVGRDPRIALREDEED